jgi:4-hydroxybenzoate polyprenyltransferase
MSHLWLPLFLINYAGVESDLKANFKASLFLFFVVLCKVMFSIQINDICDRKEDDAAGKIRWIGYLPKSIGTIISILLVAVGLTTAFLVSNSWKVILAYSATILLGLFYSLRPVRFKERGGWGLIAYALAATLIYAVVPWMWFESSLVLLIFLFVVVFADKWVQLHFHQVVDYQADLRNRTQTFAVKFGLDRTRKTLRLAAATASLFIMLLIVYSTLFLISETFLQVLAATSVLVILAAAGTYVSILKRKKRHVSDLVKELPWVYLGLTYLAFCILPPIGFTYMAFSEPLMGIIAALSALSLMSISWHSVQYKYS